MTAYPALRQVDIHTHAMPMPLLEWLAAEGWADLSGLAEGMITVDPELTGLPVGTPLVCPLAAYDVEARRAHMDSVGVEVHAVALPSYLLGSACRDSGLLRELTVRGNDELARFAAQAPDRLVAFGTAQVGLDDAAEEARRCLVDLRMPGMALGTHGGGRELADPRNQPLWELLAEHSTFTLLHPVTGPGGYGEPNVPWAASVAAGVDLALATAGLLRAAVLDLYDFPLCLSYRGGALLSLRGLMQRGAELLAEVEGAAVQPKDQLRRLYYDSATYDAHLLKNLVDFVGPAHVLMGSDFPSMVADEDPIGVIEACQFGPVQEMITGVNAMNLLRLPR